MNDATEPSEQRTSPQRGNLDNRPDAPDLLFRRRFQQTTAGNTTDEDPNRWPQSEIGPGYAARHEKASPRQHKRQDGEYIHHWWIKDQCSPKTPAIAEDAQALANTWGKELHRSADEPETEPVFSPDEIRFNAPRGRLRRFPLPARPERKREGRSTGRLRLLQHGHDALRPAGRRHHAGHQAPPGQRRGSQIRRRAPEQHLGSCGEPLPEDVPGARRAQPRQLAPAPGIREVRT